MFIELFASKFSGDVWLWLCVCIRGSCLWTDAVLHKQRLCLGPVLVSEVWLASAQAACRNTASFDLLPSSANLGLSHLSPWYSLYFLLVGSVLAHPNIEEIPYLLVVVLQSNWTLDNLIGFGVRGKLGCCARPSKEFDESKLVRPPCGQLFQFWEEIIAFILGIKSCLNQSLQSLPVP